MGKVGTMNHRIRFFAAAGQRGSVIVEYALQLYLFLFLLLVAVAVVRGDVEEVYVEASMAMQGGMQIAMTTTHGEESTQRWPSDPVFDPTDVIETSNQSEGVDSVGETDDPGSTAEPQLGGGTMSTRPNQAIPRNEGEGFPPIQDGGDGGLPGNTRTYY